MTPKQVRNEIYKFVEAQGINLENSRKELKKLLIEYEKAVLETVGEKGEKVEEKPKQEKPKQKSVSSNPRHAPTSVWHNPDV